MQVRPVDITDTAAVLAALPGADLLWLETVTNPLLGVVDLPALIAAAHDGRRARRASTRRSPRRWWCARSSYGADIVMHSATKFLSGHSDLLMGVLVTAVRSSSVPSCEPRRDLTGAMPGALECLPGPARAAHPGACGWSGRRPTRSSWRRRLAAHPAVTRVRYPGLAADPGTSGRRGCTPGTAR